MKKQSSKLVKTKKQSENENRNIQKRSVNGEDIRTQKLSVNGEDINVPITGIGIYTEIDESIPVKEAYPKDSFISLDNELDEDYPFHTNEEIVAHIDELNKELENPVFTPEDKFYCYVIYSCDRLSLQWRAANHDKYIVFGDHERNRYLDPSTIKNLT